MDTAKTRHSVDSTHRRVLLFLVTVYLFACAIVVMGFASHASAYPQIGPYTFGYAAFLVTLSFGLILPPTFTILIVRIRGSKWTVRRGVVLMIGALALYAFSEVAYASSREHNFDPFLQFPGTRLPTPIPEKGENSLRIATLGGSTTHNAHLPYETRYPTILRDNVTRSLPLLQLDVFNAGMDWWTTKHSHVNYVTYLRSWEPDLIVVMHGINDLYRSFSPPNYSRGSYDSQWSHFYGPAIRGAKPRTLLGSIRTSWTAWEFDRRWFSTIRYQEVDLNPLDFRSLPEFEANIRSLVQTLQGDGVEVILVTQPSLYRADLSRGERALLWFPQAFCVEHSGLFHRQIPSVTTMASGMHMYNDVTRRVAAETGVLLVDAAEALPRTTEFFVDDVHYTAAGAELLAQVVSGAVINRIHESRRAGLSP